MYLCFTLQSYRFISCRIQKSDPKVCDIVLRTVLLAGQMSKFVLTEVV